jgi:Rps23 Pro-64 3,4-dihydroxylase Tpa1-like proline 4-hydroxylase
MEIDKFIKIYDGGFKIEIVASLVKYAANKIKFTDAEVFGIEPGVSHNRKEIRNTEIYSFYDGSLSSTHWGHYLRRIVSNYYNNYQKTFNTEAFKIISLDILKYEVGGFYKMHSDHHVNMPRTLSVIIFLNNDYEGGELNFHDPVTNEIYKTIKPFPGRCIMWPSNFMYPHSVSPVTKGTRYAIVSWLI